MLYLRSGNRLLLCIMSFFLGDLNVCCTFCARLNFNYQIQVQRCSPTDIRTPQLVKSNHSGYHTSIMYAKILLVINIYTRHLNTDKDPYSCSGTNKLNKCLRKG